MLFLEERERPLRHQEAQEASKWDLSPFSTKNWSGVSVLSQTSQIISVPRHFHSPEGTGMSRGHRKK